MNVKPFWVGWTMIVSAVRRRPFVGAGADPSALFAPAGSAARSQNRTDEPGKCLMRASVVGWEEALEQGCFT